MAQDPLDPAQEARQIWIAASQVLQFNEALTARDKGWLSDIAPEAVFGTTIVLSVSSRAAQEAVQGELSGPLLEALKMASGREMIPAIKIVQPSATQATPSPASAVNAPMPTAQPAQMQTPDQAQHPTQNQAQAPAESAVRSGSTGEFAQSSAPSPAPLPYAGGQPQVWSDQSDSSFSPERLNTPSEATGQASTAEEADGSADPQAHRQASQQFPEQLPASSSQDALAAFPTYQAAQGAQVRPSQGSQQPSAPAAFGPQAYSQQTFAQSSLGEQAFAESPEEPRDYAQYAPLAQATAPAQAADNQQLFAIPPFMDQNQVARDPQTHLDKSATFNNFIPGASNRFARTVALAVAEGTGRIYNPLCIYGSSGLGKTHLLNAIGNYALLKDSSLKVRYVTSEEFTNEFIEALQDTKHAKQIPEFNQRYRQVDVLLIDDIQFLGGKEATLDQFFHTFNALHDANKRIVIASDVAPNKLKGFEDRLISRFESGLTVDIQPPDRETRVAILRMLAGNMGIAIPNEVFDLIAERFTENIRELEGALTRVTAMASLNNQPVTQTLAEQTLQDYFATDVEIKPTDIISQVAKYFHLTFDDLVGRTRTKNIALARQIAMYLAREMTSMSLVDIGEVFGGRDHTTVMHAYTRISNEMQEKREIYNYVMELTVRLKHPQAN
ncbi:hypothetical protein KIM372_00010 [Bombiscardovia nodaiensis]|uniref:Chromosomal replication initiator protein DnaA n=1 Tax=Bombiscardovia nodaiensis TaxID=2932181 RepID=A0ABM8B5S6_9BIFI|nr:hypothetical protein KIM372_00010 [Bombiscardovia nodaiensis]